MFTDESPFAVRYQTRPLVWRKRSERFNPECMSGTVKHMKKINIWSCFSYQGVGRFYWIKGIMDAKSYKNILIHQLQPSVNDLFGMKTGFYSRIMILNTTPNLPKITFNLSTGSC